MTAWGQGQGIHQQTRDGDRGLTIRRQVRMLSSSRMQTRTSKAMAQPGTTGTGAGDITSTVPERGPEPCLRCCTELRGWLGQTALRDPQEGVRGDEPFLHGVQLVFPVLSTTGTGKLHWLCWLQALSLSHCQGASLPRPGCSHACGAPQSTPVGLHPPSRPQPEAPAHSGFCPAAGP